MQKMWEYKRIGKSMVCLLAAGALTFSNMNIVMAADPQAVAEKTEERRKEFWDMEQMGFPLIFMERFIRTTPRSLMEAMRMDRRDAPGLHQPGLVS